ncbi:MAG: hypothetical protein IT176_10375 [Acidobacteria bacterium]|nr:hypothetical protein [Acidobacteriota bacterium]
MLKLRSRHPAARRILRSLSAAALGGLLALPLAASTPKFFQVAAQSEFLEGELDNLSIDDNGRLMLGAATDLVHETAAPFLWAITAGPDGSIFAGTGNEGKVFRIDARGNGALFFDAPELEAHALAPAPDGGLYVGTSPDGRIYKVDRNGGATVFFDPDDKYIWALAVDAAGNLYAGTGDKGLVYKIAPDGRGAPFYATKSTHATALAFDRGGNLLVATGSPGKVLRVDPQGKAFMLLDSPFDEVRALRFDADGVLYAAAQSGRPASGAAPAPDDIDRPAAGSAAQPVASVSVDVTSMAIVDTSGGGGSTGSTREDRRAPRGAVYRILPDGVWDLLWESRDDAPFDLTFDQGALLIGTGNAGKIYRLEGEPLRPTLVARAVAQQVTAFLKDERGRILYATANPGKLFRLSTARATSGTYLSAPLDAGMVATWGAITWHGTTADGTRIDVSTRSGNTGTPDDTWSPWSPAYATSGTPITSPKARYLQWRAVLSGKERTPILTSITAAYLQRNLRPEVESITVHPPGIVFQKPFSTGEPDLAGFEGQTTPERKLSDAAMTAQSGGGSASFGRRAFQKGLQTIAWRAGDDNGDDLVFDVVYRREGETAWKPIRRGVVEPILVWDTSTVPDGTYFVRIIASDAPSNPLGTALTGELDSSAFDVDNTGATIAIRDVALERGSTVVTFDVTDDHSPIRRVEFSQDGQQWRAIFPVDGISDSPSEHYALTIPGELASRGLTLRAIDAMNNTSTTHVDKP